MVAGSRTITPHTCISCAGVSRYRKLASSPDSRSMRTSSLGVEHVLVRTSRRREDTRDPSLSQPHPGGTRSNVGRMAFLRRQLVTAALTANAIRPVPGFRAGIPAFFAGWLTSELAPHLLAAHRRRHGRAASTGAAPPARRSGWRSPAANLAGLAFLIDQARRVQTNAEDALVEGLGVDYVEQLDAKPTPGRARDAVAAAGQPVPDARPRRAWSRRTSPTPPSTASAACSTSTARPTATASRRPGPAPGARRRLDDRQQGPAGHPADAAPRRQGLGLRRDQLPARAARPVPGADRRREARDRVDPRAHRRVRRRPRLHRDHRRLGRRPPDRAGRA